MPISLTTLNHAAALAGAVPGLMVQIDTDSGSTVIVGEGPGASLCPHMFREVVSQWPDHADEAPCITGVRFDGADERGPTLATGPMRWFATELASSQAVAALRSLRGSGRHLDVRVRFDNTVGMSVVRIGSDVHAPRVLDEIAVEAYAACLSEQLLPAADAAQP